jgi:acetolactate synthase-1/2/3 large subunit
MLGAHVIAQSIVRRGLKRVFVYPGGTIAPALDALRAAQVELFAGRHEQGAGYAALAVARLTGETQVAMVTSGPGVTNVATAVADAYFDSTPLVLLTGQVGTADLRGDRPVRQRGFQEVDSVALLKPITKAQFLARHPDELGEVLGRAFAIAAGGRPGPVLVDLPMNVQRGEVRAEATPMAPPAPPRAPDPACLDQLADWLFTCQRPVLLAGQGALLSGAHGALRAVAGSGGIPVTQSLLGLGAFPTGSPLALGFHGHTGNQFAGLAIHRADLVIAVGSRLDVRQTGSLPDRFAPGARVARVELDPAELEHTRVRADLAIQSDARLALEGLLGRLKGRKLPDWSRWRAQIAAWREQFPLRFAAEGPLKPQEVVAAVNRLTAGSEVVCTSGVGSHQQWAARHFDFDFPRRAWLTSGGHGAMGYDLPAALGAQLARPDALVVCFAGDGSVQMNLQELANAASLRLPIKVFALDNQRLGLVSQFQKLNWESDPTCGGKENPDFAAVARAFGLWGAQVSRREELDAAVEAALSAPGPALLHCRVDPAEDVVPMLLAGKEMDAMWPYGSLP